ncbi:MAG: hypothetical protein ACI4KM_04260 [Oscillospiraceae bacterium]
MKFAIGIILVLLLMGVLAAYLVLMLSAHEMVFCGDISNEFDNSVMYTRVYSTDISANEALTEIVLHMNDTEDGMVQSEDITAILAQYQNIVYAPVFLVSAQQVDSSTYLISGSIFNGINEKGEPAQTDYTYKNLTLSAVTGNGVMLAAQNVYSDADNNELTERKLVIDPVINDDENMASFAFSQCDSFRVIVKAATVEPLEVNLVYTYDVVAENPLNFTSVNGGNISIKVTAATDEDGRFAPTYETVRGMVIEA